MNLASGCEQLGLDLDQVQIDQLEHFLDQIFKWNRVYNLTRITHRPDMVTHHLLDSLALAQHLNDQPLLDVGSGAGFPGIPLAIALPYLDITVLDAALKRTRFSVQMKGELRLENLSVETARVEQFKSEHSFDQITARAFAPLPDLCTWTQHLLAPQGQILALKGQYPTEEISQTRALFPNAQVESEVIDVPGLDAQRHLIKVML